MSKPKDDMKLPPDNNPSYVPPPGQKPAEEAKKASTRFRLEAMPASFQAAGRIIQILTALSLPDAEQALAMVNSMFGQRKALADKPPFVPEDGK